MKISSSTGESIVVAGNEVDENEATEKREKKDFRSFRRIVLQTGT